MNIPAQSELAALERDVQHALRTLDISRLHILGYGEVTTVFRLDAASGSFACKRFPIIRSRSEAEEHIALVKRYEQALSDCGVHPVESEFAILDHGGEGVVMYLIQPTLDPHTIGPNYFRTLNEDQALDEYGRILTLMAQSVSDSMAPDGQLSNWAFVKGDLVFIDVSTPFMRDELSAERVNWDALYDNSLRGLLRPMRGYFQRKIPELLSFYYSLRGQTLDFLGNLRKERLDHFLDAFIERANTQLHLGPPLTIDEVRAYYNDNADTYAMIMGLKRADRVFHRYVLRKPYPNFIPPKLERNKF